MKIEVWSDYVCPFCYIGKRQLERAIKNLGYEGQVDVEFKSFLLDPATPIDTEELVYTSLARKYKMSEQEVKNMTRNVASRAKEVDLDYNFDNMKTANTTVAHRLAKLAAIQGKAEMYNERLMKAYFLEGEAIGRRDVLERLAQEIELDMEAVGRVLKGNEYEEAVEKDMYEARQIGVRGVPFFVFNNKYGLSGAQPQSVFEQMMEQIASEVGLKKRVNPMNQERDVCSNGYCEI